MKNKQRSRHVASGNFAKIHKRHAVDAGGNDEEAGRHHEPERRNPVNHQERGKEDRARFFSGHVAQATAVHEQVTNDRGPLSEASKEAPGHQ
ncbi:hypothetical protein [Arthrobacter sp. OAP107]|uniref:hypothetical protein n=1 Tax=Arthrobacter sp. OAP107 TaxID=3156445 RepID=UPI00339947CA